MNITDLFRKMQALVESGIQFDIHGEAGRFCVDFDSDVREWRRVRGGAVGVTLADAVEQAVRLIGGGES